MREKEEIGKDADRDAAKKPDEFEVLSVEIIQLIKVLQF